MDAKLCICKCIPNSTDVFDANSLNSIYILLCNIKYINPMYFINKHTKSLINKNKF